MAKCPYTFPHRSRAAMLDYICERRGHDGFRLAWDVKAYSADWTGCTGEEKTDSRFDAAWQQHTDSHPNFSGWMFEEAGRLYSGKEYTTYPGEDQGDWDFRFCGRSGGWLGLAAWKGRDMRAVDPEDLCSGLDFEALRTFYRALRCMDADFTRDKASAEVSYHVNFARAQWEAEQLERETQAAREMEESRPDMYANISLQLSRVD